MPERPHLQVDRARAPAARPRGRWARTAPAPRPAPTPVPRQLDVDALAAAIARLPSRAHMVRPRPKADFLEHVWHFYSTLHRWARGVGSGAFDCSWAQLVKACGYADDAKVQHSVERYRDVLAELGLAQITGVRDGAGRWQRLDVVLLDPPDEHTGGPGGASGGAPGPAGGRGGPRAAATPTWRVRRLRAAERRLLVDVCAGARAGRAPRLLAPRLQRLQRCRNLRPPESRGVNSVPPPAARALRGRPSLVVAGDDRGVTRSSATTGAHGGGRAADGCAEVAALAGHEPPPGGVVASIDAVQGSLVRAWGLEGDRVALVAAARTALAGGVDGAVVVQAAWRALNGGGPAAGLSSRRRRQLDVALARLDRYALFGAGRRGAGVQLAVERIADDHDEPPDERLQRLSGVVAWLRATAASWRRADRVRRGLREPYRPKPLPDRARRRPSGGAWPWPTQDCW